MSIPLFYYGDISGALQNNILKQMIDNETDDTTQIFKSVEKDKANYQNFKQIFQQILLTMSQVKTKRSVPNAVTLKIDDLLFLGMKVFNNLFAQYLATGGVTDFVNVTAGYLARIKDFYDQKKTEYPQNLSRFFELLRFTSGRNIDFDSIDIGERETVRAEPEVSEELSEPSFFFADEPQGIEEYENKLLNPGRQQLLRNYINSNLTPAQRRRIESDLESGRTISDVTQEQVDNEFDENGQAIRQITERLANRPRLTSENLRRISEREREALRQINIPFGNYVPRLSQQYEQTDPERTIDELHLNNLAEEQARRVEYANRGDTTTYFNRLTNENGNLNDLIDNEARAQLRQQEEARARAETRRNNNAEIIAPNAEGGPRTMDPDRVIYSEDDIQRQQMRGEIIRLRGVEPANDRAVQILSIQERLNIDPRIMREFNEDIASLIRVAQQDIQTQEEESRRRVEEAVRRDRRRTEQIFSSFEEYVDNLTPSESRTPSGPSLAEVENLTPPESRTPSGPSSSEISSVARRARTRTRRIEEEEDPTGARAQPQQEQPQQSMPTIEELVDAYFKNPTKDNKSSLSVRIGVLEKEDKTALKKYINKNYPERQLSERKRQTVKGIKELLGKGRIKYY